MDGGGAIPMLMQSHGRKQGGNDPKRALGGPSNLNPSGDAKGRTSFKTKIGGNKSHNPLGTTEGVEK